LPAFYILCFRRRFNS
jgi:hypothetical protein